jgi:hypothetical protein
LKKDNPIVASSHVSENRWNDALQRADVDGTLFQSSYWAEYVRKVHGDQPIYLFSIDKKGDINGQLLAFQSWYGNFPLSNHGKYYITSLGITKRKLYEIAFKKVFKKIFPFFYWQNGPVVVRNSLNNYPHESDKIYCGLIGKILNISEKRGVYAIKLARPSYFMDCTKLMDFYGFKKRKMGTILVDLKPPVELIWKSIHRNVRRNIIKIKDNIIFDEARSLKDLQIFYNLLVQLTKRLEIEAYPFHHYKSLWNFFHPLKKIVSFIAFLKDKPIGASITLLHNNMIHVYMYADSDFARSNKIYINDALMWHIIKWSRERGFKYLDLGGAFLYRINSGDLKARNIYIFKSKFGKTIEFNDYWKETDRSILHLRLKGAKMLNLFIPEGSGCFIY